MLLSSLQLNLMHHVSTPLFFIVGQFGMIKFLFGSHPSGKVTLPALQALGNIAAGDDVQTQVKRTMYNLFLILLKHVQFKILTF